MPGFADWAGVDLVTPDGDVEQVAIAHADPEMVELAHRSRERYPPDLEEDQGPRPRAAHRRDRVLARDPRRAAGGDAPQDEEHLELLRSVGLRSAVIAPLRFGDR